MTYKKLIAVVAAVVTMIGMVGCSVDRSKSTFIAKELDFGALGSSPLARGLSAPLNIPYSVAFVLDVAGVNEALVARNGSGINSITDLKGKRVATPFASTAHYSLLAALAQNGLSPKDVQLIDLQPQAILADWERGGLHLAADPRSAPQDRQGPDHQPAACQGRQAHPGPGRGVELLRQGAPVGRRRLAQAAGAGADRHPRRPGRGGEGHRRRNRFATRRCRSATEAERVPDTPGGRFPAMAGHPGQPR